MKLTKSHRQAFVKAVMQDVPTVNYEDELHKFARQCAINYLPPQLQAMALDKDLSLYFNHDTVWFDHHRTGIGAIRVIASRSNNFHFKAEDGKVADSIMAKAQQQRIDREALKERIEGVIASCTTLKTAKERLPEFVKYLPEEMEKSTTLPAIANIVADLTKLGWPKDKQLATA